MLNVVYCTGRVDPKIEWFLASLAREVAGDFSAVKVIVVDYWANPFGGTRLDHEQRRSYVFGAVDAAGIPQESVNWVAPKSTPWQGKQRQTHEDWFNVANSRNTGLCFCDDGWVAFVDDLSVLMPGWFSAAVQATMTPKMITLGRYRKVRKLVVEGGNVVSFEPAHITDQGVDTGQDARERAVKALDKPFLNAPSDWHFGYVMGPVQAYLDINGWVETLTAGLSFEDVPTGINLGKKGYGFRYDPRMFAMESEEGHGQGPGMKKADYRGKDWGRTEKDKSHAVLAITKQGNGFTPNDFFNGMTISELRDHVYRKANNSFPMPKPNYREWFSGYLLSELHRMPADVA